LLLLDPVDYSLLHHIEKWKQAFSFLWLHTTGPKRVTNEVFPELHQIGAGKESLFLPGSRSYEIGTV
jgi:hypothetical protein